MLVCGADQTFLGGVASPMATIVTLLHCIPPFLVQQAVRETRDAAVDALLGAESLADGEEFLF